MSSNSPRMRLCKVTEVMEITGGDASLCGESIYEWGVAV
jgi:hypothetical protein